MKRQMRCKCGSEWMVVCPHCHQYAPPEQWISTKDSFPPPYQAVLAYHKKDGIVYAYRWLDYEESEYGPAEYAWEYKEGKSIPQKDSRVSWSEHFVAEDTMITHWMPLPKVPNGMD